MYNHRAVFGEWHFALNVFRTELSCARPPRRGSPGREESGKEQLTGGQSAGSRGIVHSPFVDPKNLHRVTARRAAIGTQV